MKKKPKKALMKATHKSLKFYGDVLCSLPEDRTRPILTSIPPEQFVLGPSSSLYSGVFFGVTCDDSGKKIVGKRMDDDAHILIAGGSGQGKTQGIVIPTMATWTGSQIVLDIKGELLDFHSQLSKKRVIVFSPENLDGKSYHYDPFAPLRHDSKDAIAGHAWALARTLIPKSSHLQDPIWIDTAQSFLTAALIYYYDLGVMFVDAINAIVTTGIQEIIQQIMNGSCELAKVRIHQIAKVSENVLSSIGMELNLLSPLITDSSMRNAITVSSNEKELKRCDNQSLEDLRHRNNANVLFTFPSEKRTAAKTSLVLKTPKTESSVRDVFLPETVANALRQMQISQERSKNALGEAYKDFNLVLAHENGRPYEERQIADLLRNFIRDANLPPVVFHSLRHCSTSVKLQLSNGNIKAVQGDTGHAQARMVTDTYAHTNNEERRILAQKMDQSFFQGTTKDTSSPASEIDERLSHAIQIVTKNPDIANLIIALSEHPSGN